MIHNIFSIIYSIKRINHFIIAKSTRIHPHHRIIPAVCVPVPAIFGGVFGYKTSDFRIVVSATEIDHTAFGILELSSIAYRIGVGGVGIILRIYLSPCGIDCRESSFGNGIYNIAVCVLHIV